MTERWRNIVVGLTALTGLAGLALMMVMFGYLPQFLEKGYTVRVRLTHAGGLTAGSVARLSGIPIGRIKQVDFEPPPSRGVVATLLVEPHVRIPSHATVNVVAPLLAGSPSLAFDTTQLAAEQMLETLPTDGSAMVEGSVPSLLSQFSETMQAQMKQPLEQLARMEIRFNALTDEWTKVGHNLEKMTYQPEPGAMDDRPPGVLIEAITRGSERLEEMREVMTDLRAALNKAQGTADQISETSKKVGTAADAAGEGFTRLTNRYVAVADDLSAAIADVRRLTSRATEGQGTVGKMLNDPALYDSLLDTTQRLGMVMDELKLLIEKWKAEGVPIQF